MFDENSRNTSQASLQRKGPAKSVSICETEESPVRFQQNQLIVRVVSSTYHLSQVALRELRLRLRQELPDFSPDNLLVELGSYGAFDVHVGDTKICEVSATVTYPPVSAIVAKVIAVANNAASAMEQQHYRLLHQPQQPRQSETSDLEHFDAEESTVSSRSTSSALSSVDYAQQPSELLCLTSSLDVE